MENPNPELSERIQGLPQELQDIIFDFTLAFDPVNKNVQLSRDYKAPWQLQISRATRQKQAAIYFGTSIFLFQLREDFPIYRILRSMTARQRGMIATFRCEMDWATPTDSKDRLRRDVPSVVHKDAFANGVLSRLQHHLERRGVALPCRALQTNIPADTVEGRVNVWLSLNDFAQD